MLPALPSFVVGALGWTLLHSLWQGALVAGVLAVILWLRRTGSSNERYLHACTALLLAVLLPLVTLALELRQGYPWPVLHVAPEGRNTYDPSLGVSAIVYKVLAVEPATPPRPAALPPVLARWFPLLVDAWLAGVLLLSLRLALAWAGAQRLRHVRLQPVEPSVRRSLEDLAVRLGIHRPVWIMVSGAVTVPTLVGWLRPLVLLPTTALTGLSSTQLEAILAHELAHVRRHDYLVNLIQSLAETLLFHHPAVWWISSRIREERENCCDDMAVALVGNTLDYSRALARMEQLRGAVLQARLAASGGVLLERIRRLVLPDSAIASRRAPLGAVLLTLCSVAAMFGYSSTPESLRSPTQSPDAILRAEARQAERAAMPVTLHLVDVSLREACDEVTRQSGIAFELPADAATERVTVDFDAVSAGVVVQSMFNPMLMDYPFDPVREAIVPRWWPGDGPQPGRVRSLSLENFHARQAMFTARHHPVDAFDMDARPLRDICHRITEITGIRFHIQEGYEDLPVTIHSRNTEAWDIVQAAVDQLGLDYDYDDDSSILVFQK